jgi:DNA-binding transcriptional regulator YiaG
MPPCCRPFHFFVGTRADNNRDMTEKKRNRRGSRHHAARIDESSVLQLLQLRSEGIPQAQLAEMFGISVPTVSEITNRKSWKHVTLP